MEGLGKMRASSIGVLRMGERERREERASTFV